MSLSSLTWNFDTKVLSEVRSHYWHIHTEGNQCAQYEPTTTKHVRDIYLLYKPNNQRLIILTFTFGKVSKNIKHFSQKYTTVRQILINSRIIAVIFIVLYNLHT